jgi:hypothetical protein
MVNIPAYQRVNRTASVPGSLKILFKYIPGSIDGMNHLLVEIVIDLIPQLAYANFDHVGLWIKIVIPDMFHNHGLGDHIPGIAHEVLK